MSEEKFSKCEEGEKKCKCRISGVRKKRIGRKVAEKKNEVFFALHQKKDEVKNFAKFAFTGWALG